MAYCGLNCKECPAYLATQNDSDDERMKVAKMWGKLFKMEFKVEDINCDGCKSDGRLFGHCNMCSVRLCGKEKEIETCGHCDDYGCDKLNGILKMLSGSPAKDNLEKIRKSL